MMLRPADEPVAIPQPSSYQILPPITSEGLGLSAAGRLGAEAARGRAMVIAIAASAESGSFENLDLDLLTAFDPTLTWAHAGAASTSPSIASIAPQGTDRAVIAVAAGNGVCAYGLISPSGPVEVTVEMEAPCAAASPPAELFA